MVGSRASLIYAPDLQPRKCDALRQKVTVTRWRKAYYNKQKFI
jgi:hypothetical protein